MDTSSSSPIGDTGINRKLEKAKTELQQMIDLNPEVMILVKPDGIVERANQSLLNLLGFADFEKVLGQPLNRLFLCDDTDLFTRLLASQTTYEVCETQAKMPCGKECTLEFTVVGSTRQAELLAVIVRDVTTQKEQAVVHERQYKKEAVRSLMGALMHNVNQPLTVIMVKTQLMHVALEKGRVSIAEFKDSLEDIMSLTIQVSDLLEHISQPRDYVTQSYTEGVDILDIAQVTENTDTTSEVTWLDTLKTLTSALDTHEPSASLHARRTSRYAAILARAMGHSDSDVKEIERSAYLHDIGKVGIPDAILQKPAKLTDTEMKLMRKHAEIGYRLLRYFPFLGDDAQVAYAHHEWFNGNGYPRSIAGDDIPMPARITAVADVFDAMRLNRPYAAALPLEEAVEQISAGSRTQFDPEIVKAFKSCYKDMEGDVTS